MSGRSFLDTNVLVYTDDADSPDKQGIALDLVADLRATGTGVLSTQVLQEYFSAATRKLGVNPTVARRKVEIFARLQLVEIQLESILGAIDLHRLHQVSFWNGLILRVAIDAGCKTLYSEDLQDGSSIAGIDIRNPFRQGL